MPEQTKDEKPLPIPEGAVDWKPLEEPAKKLVPSPEDVAKSQPPEGWQEVNSSPEPEENKPIFSDWRKEQAEKGRLDQMPAPGEWVPVGEKSSPPEGKSSEDEK